VQLLNLAAGKAFLLAFCRQYWEGILKNEIEIDARCAWDFGSVVVQRRSRSGMRQLQRMQN
jgi:hypothetical protein